MTLWFVDLAQYIKLDRRGLNKNSENRGKYISFFSLIRFWFIQLSCSY